MSGVILDVRCDVYRNLNKPAVTYSVRQRGKVVAYAGAVVLRDCEFKHASDFQRAACVSRRLVCQWVKGFVENTGGPWIIPLGSYNSEIAVVVVRRASPFWSMSDRDLARYIEGCHMSREYGADFEAACRERNSRDDGRDFQGAFAGDEAAGLCDWFDAE